MAVVDTWQPFEDAIVANILALETGKTVPEDRAWLTGEQRDFVITGTMENHQGLPGDIALDGTGHTGPEGIKSWYERKLSYTYRCELSFTYRGYHMISMDWDGTRNLTLDGPLTIKHKYADGLRYTSHTGHLEVLGIPEESVTVDVVRLYSLDGQTSCHYGRIGSEKATFAKGNCPEQRPEF
jgi:hypothetical protein